MLVSCRVVICELRKQLSLLPFAVTFSFGLCSSSKI